MLVFIRQSPGWEHRHASGVDLYSTGLRGVEVDGIRVVIDDPCPRLCRGKTRHVAVRVQHSKYSNPPVGGACEMAIAQNITGRRDERTNRCVTVTIHSIQDSLG